jgi:multidrug efflux pump subunit AcrB
MRAWIAVLLVACGSRGHTPSVHEQLVVTTSYPGASAAVVESSVTTPLERQLGQMPHLSEMRSRSSVGSSRIELVFEPGTELDAALQDVQAAINVSMKLLPRSLPAPPIYVRTGEIVARYAVTSQTLPLTVVRDALEPVEQKVAMLPGVGLVESCGAPRREIDVDVDTAALAGAGLTIIDLVTAIRSAPAFDGSPSLVVATRNGAPVRLADVAQIRQDGAAPECTATTERGRVVELIMWAQPGADRKAVRERVDATLTDMRIRLPTGIEIQNIGEMHVWSVAAEGRGALAHVTEGVSSEHLLIEQRDNTMRVAVALADDQVDAMRARLAQVPDITAVEPDALLELTSADRDQLMAFAASVRAKIGPAIALGLDRSPEQHIELDRDTMTRLGVTAQQADDTLLALGGITASTVFGQLTQTPVVVHVTSEPETLDRLYVRTATGTTVPLSAFARTVAAPDGERWHAGQFPMVGFRVRAASLPDLAELHAPDEVHVRVVRD